MTLANHPISDRLYVTFWGTRGSISTPGSSTGKYGGNTACVSVQFKDTEIILDAGTGIRNLGIHINQQAKARKQNSTIHLLLSHTHWDHIQGIPFFEPAYTKGNSIRIYGSQKKERFLEGILRGQMDINYFPVEMNALAADISITEISKEEVHIGPMRIEWQEQVAHPGGSVRFRISAGDKRMVYASDVELDRIFTTNNAIPSAKKLAAEYEDFIKNVDLLIADGQYTAEEYPSKAGYGHTSIPKLIDVAHRMNVKQLAVFHHDPQHSDTMLDRLWKSTAPQYALKENPMNLFWAREGMTISV